MKNTFPKPPIPAFLNNNTAHKTADKIARKLANILPRVVKQLPDPPFLLQKKIGEKLLKHLLAEQIETGEFDFLQDRWLQLSINDMGLNFFLTFQNDQLMLSNQSPQVDVHFSGDSKEFILLASRNEDPDTLFFQRRLVIEGDTELGLYIKNSIDGIDFDNWPNWLNQTIQKIASFVSDEQLQKDSTNKLII